MPDRSFWSFLAMLVQVVREDRQTPSASAKRRSAAKAGGMAIAGVTVAALAGWQMTYTSGWEGIRFTPYMDVTGVLTVCIGHTGPDIIAGKTYSKDECSALFAADMATVDAALSSCVHTPAPLKPAVVVALRDFAFNVGTTAACNSTLVRKLNSGDTAGACDEFQRWTKAGGRPVYGLKVRRELGVPDRMSEADLCRSAL